LVDDFHRLPNNIQSSLADYLKVLADTEEKESKIIILGINRAGDNLIRFAPDLVNRIDVVRFETEPDEKISELIHKGENALKIRFNVVDEIVETVRGSFYLAQMLCRNICLASGILEASSDTIILNSSFESIQTAVWDKQIKTEAGTINLVRGGSGYPILLLHGYPETHACWHRVAPVLAEQFTVVCTDLRGCGDSFKPQSDAEHLTYSKRVMAHDQVEVMLGLGFREFGVVGHDRGARVAHRMALDHSARVPRLALLDIIPTNIAFEATNQEIATAAFNWFFSIQPDGLPERLIGSERVFYLHWILDHWSGSEGALAAEAIAEYERCFDAATIRATNEEFRAAATIDLVHDESDRSRKISCPTLLLWRATGMWATYGVLEIWRTRAENVSGVALDCGHFLPEEDSARTAAELIWFFS
jgi:haloacetate dehalogenase